jgi:hypothetical protein
MSIRERSEKKSTVDRQSVALGLEHTGGVITGAALIMMVVFGTFMLADLSMMREMGFALAAAVLLDATIVRVVLVPATMRLMGKWNWWLPGWLDRILPQVVLDEAGVPAEDVISATSSYRIFVDEQWETRKGQAWGYLQAVCGRMGCAFPRKDGRCSLTKSLGHVKLWAGP